MRDDYDRKREDILLVSMYVFWDMICKKLHSSTEVQKTEFASCKLEYLKLLTKVMKLFKGDSVLVFSKQFEFNVELREESASKQKILDQNQTKKLKVMFGEIGHRSRDLMHAKHALYHLSYFPEVNVQAFLTKILNYT